MADLRFLFWRARREPIPDLPGMNPPKAAAAAKPRGARQNYSLTDAVLVGAGIGLMAACATFPWYVFFNQDKFGLVARSFDEAPQPEIASGPFYTPRVQWAAKPVATQDNIASLPLDYVPTGTVASPDAPATAPEQAQDYPLTPARYSLVHVANGRAMIKDENGFFVVERGSVLPDNSRVVAIENRSGVWVLKTSDNRTVELDP